MSLLGSILSNLLLVLGCCFLFGGIYFKQQEFNAVANQASSSLLFLSCIGVVLPTAAAQLAPAGKPGMSAKDVLDISRGTAVILLAIYIAYLAFQLHTHAHLFGGGNDDGEPVLTLPGAFGALAVVTVAVAACSEFLTGSIETFSEETKLPQAFVGMIILPIAGNAAEHVVSFFFPFDSGAGVVVPSSSRPPLSRRPLQPPSQPPPETKTRPPSSSP
jgi:Ca2+:H+ antiporter